MSKDTLKNSMIVSGNNCIQRAKRKGVNHGLCVGDTISFKSKQRITKLDSGADTAEEPSGPNYDPEITNANGDDVDSEDECVVMMIPVIVMKILNTVYRLIFNIFSIWL